MTEVDRAREVYATKMDHRYGVGHWLAEEIRAGKWDHDEAIQSLLAFAAQARSEALEEAARVAEDYAEERTGSLQEVAGERIAAAIRQLKDQANG